MQPARGEFKSLFDALQLAACGLTPPATADRWTAVAHHPAPPEGTLVLTVDPQRGDDRLGAAQTAPASEPAPAPYRTIAAAIEASRRLRAGTPGQPAELVLRGGTHWLAETIKLSAGDSWLTVRNADGEEAVISGGAALVTDWRLSRRCGGCFEASLAGQQR